MLLERSWVPRLPPWLQRCSQRQSEAIRVLKSWLMNRPLHQRTAGTAEVELLRMRPQGALRAMQMRGHRISAVDRSLSLRFPPKQQRRWVAASLTLLCKFLYREAWKCFQDLAQIITVFQQEQHRNSCAADDAAPERRSLRISAYRIRGLHGLIKEFQLAPNLARQTSGLAPK